jgi:hypothetical protein
MKPAVVALSVGRCGTSVQDTAVELDLHTFADRQWLIQRVSPTGPVVCGRIVDLDIRGHGEASTGAYSGR